MPYSDPIPELKRILGAEVAAAVSCFYNDDAACLLETDRCRIAELRRGKLERFSLETLIRFFIRLGGRWSCS